MKLEFEVVVLGGGVIGSSVAMHLANLGVKSVAVVDPDLEGRFSSSELNAGGVRATFVQEVNIALSKRSIEFFENNAEEVGFRQVGYLWMFREDRWEAAKKARQFQEQKGWKVEEWSVETLRRQRPFIDKTEDLAGALFSPGDGLVNPNRLKNFFREKAKTNGVQFIDRWALVGAEEMPKEKKWRLTGVKPGSALETYFTSERESQPLETAPEIFTEQVVNATGAWAPRIAKYFGLSCPSKPVRRQISVFDCKEVNLSAYGMMVDPSGVYFHPEASNGMGGIALPETPGINFHYDGEDFFEEHIWPSLYERSTGFERLKHLTGWAGLYEVSPDETAIIGPTEKRGVYDCHSFSGHGVMQAYAAGELLAELMMGRPSFIQDPYRLSGKRFQENKTLPEKWVI